VSEGSAAWTLCAAGLLVLLLDTPAAFFLVPPGITRMATAQTMSRKVQQHGEAFFDAILYFKLTFDRNEWISTFNVAIVIFDGLVSQTVFFDVNDGLFDICASI
jgi:hypothetical protein